MQRVFKNLMLQSCKAMTIMQGAITGVTTVKNPISLARHVMENTKHVMFSGEGAEIIARGSTGSCGPFLFLLRENLKRLKNQQSKDDKLGTVGVVAVDKKGIIGASKLQQAA